MKISSIEKLEKLLKEVDNDNNENINKYFIENDQKRLDLSHSLSSIRVLINRIDKGMSQISSYIKDVEDIENSTSKGEEFEEIEFDFSEWENNSYNQIGEEETIQFAVDNALTSMVEYIENVKEVEELIKDYKGVSEEDLDYIKDILDSMSEIVKEIEKLAAPDDFNFKEMESSLGKTAEKSKTLVEQLENTRSELESLDEENEDEIEALSAEIGEIETEITDNANEGNSFASDILSEASDILEKFEEYSNNLWKIFYEIEENVSNLECYELFENNNFFNANKIDEENFDELENSKKVNLRLTIPGNNKHSGDWIIFHDSSIYYKNNKTENEYKPSQQNVTYFNQKIKEMVKSFISFKCRKHPSITDVITGMVLKEKSLSTALSLVDEIMHNKKVLLKHDFNINEIKYPRIENVYDQVQKILLNEKAESFVKRLFDGKYRTLILDENGKVNKNIQKIGLNMIELGLDKKNFNDNFGKKLDYFLNLENSTIEEKRNVLKENFTDYVRKYSGWSKEGYMTKVKTLKTGKVVHHDKHSMIIKVDSHKDCKTIGSPAWCISRSEGFWDNYRRSGEFFIKMDFSLDSKDNNSIIGFHLNKEMEITHAHLKNDNALGLGREILIKDLESRGMRRFKNDFIFMNDEKYNNYIKEFMEKEPDYSGGGTLEIRNAKEIPQIRGEWDDIVIKNSKIDSIHVKSKNLTTLSSDIGNITGEVIYYKDKGSNIEVVEMTSMKQELRYSEINELRGKSTTLNLDDIESSTLINGVFGEVKANAIKGLDLGDAKIDVLNIENSQLSVNVSRNAQLREVESKRSELKLNAPKINVGFVSIMNSEKGTEINANIAKLKLDTLDNVKFDINKLSNLSLDRLKNVEQLKLTEDTNILIDIIELENVESINNIDSTNTRITIDQPGDLKQCSNNNLNGLIIKETSKIEEISKNKIGKLEFYIDPDQELVYRRNRIKEIVTNAADRLKNSSERKTKRVQQHS